MFWKLSQDLTACISLTTPSPSDVLKLHSETATRCLPVKPGNGPKDLQKQWDLGRWQVHSNGPAATDLLRMILQAQGSMGIVTWVSLRCELLPTIKKMFLAPAKKSTDLEDFVYKAIWARVGDKLFVMNKAYLATLMGETAEEICELKKVMPNWTAAFGLSADILLPELKVNTQELDVMDYAKQDRCSAADESSRRCGR